MLNETEKQQIAMGHFRLSLNGVLFPLNAIMSVDRIIQLRQEIEHSAITLHQRLNEIEGEK